MEDNMNVKDLMIIFSIMLIGIIMFLSLSCANDKIGPNGQIVFNNMQKGGQVWQVKNYILNHSRDPDSVVFESWYKLKELDGGDGYQVSVNVRGKNGFGGYTKQKMTFILDDTGQVLLKY